MFAAALMWVTLDTVNNAPARDATASLGEYGLVTIRLTTEPFPPLPTGTVALHFMPMDARGRPVVVDGVRFEYGAEGSDQPVGADEAEPMPDGSGMFMGGARFPYVGNWWVRLNVRRGGEQATLRFLVNVEPAQ